MLLGLSPRQEFPHLSHGEITFGGELAALTRFPSLLPATISIGWDSQSLSPSELQTGGRGHLNCKQEEEAFKSKVTVA